MIDIKNHEQIISMDVGTEGWKVYAVGDNRIKEIVKRQEDSVEIELEESAQNPIYWFRNKDDIIASIKKLVGFGSTRFQEFMNRVDAIEEGHKESSTKLADLNNDMLVAIMKEATPESWANLMLAATEPIPADQRESVVGLDGISYTPKYRRNSSLWEANKHVIEKNCNEFLQNNRENDITFCVSKEPLHKICRHRTDRCNKIYNFYQQEVIPIPGQNLAFGQDLAYRIKDGVTSIEFAAFESSNLYYLSIPDSVTEIGESAFYRCSIKSVKISKSVTVIPPYAFANSRLKSVIIPNSVTHIRKHAFDGCRYLETVKLSEKLTRIDNSAFRSCSILKSVIIPDSVEKIHADAFSYCRELETIKFPESLTFIGPDAFHGCESLDTVTIPKSIKRISRGVFMGCHNLRSVTIPESVEMIENKAFRNCSNLTSVTIPESIEWIEWGAFDGCKKLDKATRDRLRSIEREHKFY